jgi:hypothetical protein
LRLGWDVQWLGVWLGVGTAARRNQMLIMKHVVMQFV